MSVTDSLFTANRARLGGALDFFNGNFGVPPSTLTIANSAFVDNLARVDPGAARRTG